MALCDEPGHIAVPQDSEQDAILIHDWVEGLWLATKRSIASKAESLAGATG